MSPGRRHPQALPHHHRAWRWAAPVAGAATLIVGALGAPRALAALPAFAAPPTFAGVPAAAGAPAGVTKPPPAAASADFVRLAPAQVRARSSGRHERVIVVLSDRLSTLPADRRHVQDRLATAAVIQAPLVTQLRQVRASDIVQLSLVDAVAADMPTAEVAALRGDRGVAEVVPDRSITVGTADTTTGVVSSSRVRRSSVPAVAPDGQRYCPASPADPLLEPEALTSIHDASNDPERTDEASHVATGKGVIVAVLDADAAAGNPNMIRPDGRHVIIDAPDEDDNEFETEFNGDVSTIAAQGTVVSSYGQQLPYSHLPVGCTFRIVGDATGVSIVDEGTHFAAGRTDGTLTLRESRIIAGLDRAVETEHADVVSESYGFGLGDVPGANEDLLAPTNDAMVAAGVTVVESAGDSGASGTVEAPADDPEVIDAGATDDLRMEAQAYGYRDGWEEDSMATLSSGGVTPNGRVVDLVAPGYCSLALAGVGNDPPLPTESFGGTSESAPFVAGAAADVIQAYTDTHDGTAPTPALVKEILTATARDIGAGADQQGSGLVDVYAAVEAARQMPGTTAAPTPRPELVADPSQVDVSGAAATTVSRSVSLYNASTAAVTVTGTYRSLGVEKPVGPAVSEKVGSPAVGTAIPARGATAAAPISFQVPAGAAQLDADMRWPDPTNGSILVFALTDPAGRLAQVSYDYGGAHGPADGPDIQHSTVQHPMVGRWTAQILWGDGRGHVQAPPETPGTYTGDVVFRAGTQEHVAFPASAPVTIPARSAVTVPLRLAMPAAPGDTAESVQFRAATGKARRGTAAGRTVGTSRAVSSVVSSLPVALRTLIPSSGGTFSADLTSSVSRGAGQIKTFYVDVPAGRRDLDVYLHAPDHAADDPVHCYLISPAGLRDRYPLHGQLDPLAAVDVTPTPDSSSGNAVLIAPDPQAGAWEIDVMQGPTTNGTTFSQEVAGSLTYDALKPVIGAGLPTSTSTVIDAGARRTVTVSLTNTTRRPAAFFLVAPGQDISGGAATRAVHLLPGATGKLATTLSPVAAVGTPVVGTLRVLTSGDFDTRDPFYGRPGSRSTLASLAYAYTVGAPS